MSMQSEGGAKAVQHKPLIAKLAARLREHDWFALLVELFVVVLGIFIGLQADNWNRERIEARDRAEALDRLQNESERSVTYFRTMVADLRRGDEARAKALQLLALGHWSGAEAELLQGAIGSLRLAPTVAPPRSVYDELVASGNFAKLGDRRLREAITAYYAELGLLGGQIDYLRSLIVVGEQRRQIGWTRIAMHPGSSEPFDSSFDLANYGRDLAFLAYVGEGAYLQRRQADFWAESLAAAEAMCGELARTTGKPCKPEPAQTL